MARGSSDWVSSGVASRSCSARRCQGQARIRRGRTGEQSRGEDTVRGAEQQQSKEVKAKSRMRRK